MQVRPFALAAALMAPATCLAMDPGGWSPFGPVKWLVISVLTLVTIALAAWSERIEIEPRLTLLWAGLVAVMGVAAIGGLDPLYAWTGTPERHLGVLTWLLIGAAFVAGQQLRWSDRNVLSLGIAAAGWIVGGYAAVEAAWRAPIRLDTTSDRLGGPFGSPAFLGAACALLVPILLGIAAERSMPRWLRWAGGLAAPLCAIALIGSGARAAWVATGITAVITAAAARRRAAPGSVRACHVDRRRSGTAIARTEADRPGDGSGPVRADRRRGARSSRRAALTVRWRIGLLAAVAGTAVLGAVLLGGQLGSIVERSHGAGSRVDEWRVAGRVIADHPLLGTGPEGYRLAVPGNVDAAYERAYGRAVVPDRAHSGMLDVTATGGIAAGLLYATLLVLVAWLVWRTLRTRDGLRAGIAAGVGAYLLQQQLLFPLAELDPIAWLLAGALVAWGRTSPRQMSLRAPRWQRLIGSSAAALAVAALIAGVLDVAADRIDKRALVSISEGRAVDAVELADRAVGLRPDVVRYRLVLARAEQATATLSGVDRSLESIDRALDISPLDPLLRQERGLALNRRAAITGTDDDTAAALADWQELVAIDRVNARWQLELGRAAAAANDIPTARAAWTRAADLAPDDPTAPALLAELPAG
jgi:O-antigen ligase